MFSSDEDVDLYRDAYSPFWHEPEERVPSAAVAPDRVEQVQEIVKIAEPLQDAAVDRSRPARTGLRRLGAEAVSGSVVVDLKRMNRILEVDEREPLRARRARRQLLRSLPLHRRTQDLKVWIDPADPGWGSLIGNALDRGGGYTRAIPRSLRRALRHGSRAAERRGRCAPAWARCPNAKTWQLYKYGFGPWIDGIFSQSNFGIVTKMGFWLMPEPEALAARAA